VSYDRQFEARENNPLSKQAFDKLPVKETITLIPGEVKQNPQDFGED